MQNLINVFYVPESGLRMDNVTIPIRGGGAIKLDQMSISSSYIIGTPPLILRSKFGGDEYRRENGSVFSTYRFECGRNMNARTRFPAISVTVPGQSFKAFRKSY